jgi:PAS domain S-box-containing protein
MKKNPKTKEQLLAENEDLRRRLDEAEETLRAIQEGEVDALVLSKPQGDVVFSLTGAEQPYRIFVEAMNEGAATLDPEGTILYCNNRFAEMLKIPADKVIGSSIHRFIPPADRPGFESAFQGGKEQDTTVDISLKREGQLLIPVHLSCSMLHDQEMPVVCIVAMDLTEHKRLEDALRQLNADLEKRVQDRTAELIKVNETLQESEKRWATTLTSIGDAVIATDEGGRIRFMNAVAEGLTGWTLSEASQKPVKQVFKIINENTRLEVEDPVAKVIETGMICSLANHTLLVRKDGTEVAIDDSGAPIRNETGKIMGVVLVFRDISERRCAEEGLRKYREELEIRVQERTVDLKKANEALRHVSSRLMSAQEDERKRIAGELHDTIGSTLNGIKYKVEIALQQLGKTADVAKESLSTTIPVIQEGIDECRRMQQDLRPSMLDDLGLLPTLSWFCRRYETIYTGIKVELEQTLEETYIPDALKIVIFRVTQEGMNNIAKHSKADLVHLSLRKMDGRIELVLKDNGQGFDLKKVLGSESTKRGLGLTSMRERTELSGGSFNIESSKGKGTIVRASWPLNQSC